MTAVCRVCLRETDGEDYHPVCLRRLFGSGRLPALDVELSKLHTAALAMVGHTSLSGAQKKISISLTADRATLQVAAEGGRYILKPQADRFQALPENEHVTTCLANLAGIETGPFGLVPLSDGSNAYIVSRFDRLASGKKLHQEDFCQLAEQSPAEKYRGSAELCVRLLRQHASEPLVEALKLYRLLVFSWWSGNGDMHLKNFSLQTDEEGHHRLTPAYDLVCTRLVIRDDPLALPVAGKREHLTRNTWLLFADYSEIPRKAAERVLDEQRGVLDDAIDLVARCFLPNDMKGDYQNLLRSRSEVLSGTK